MTTNRLISMHVLITALFVCKHLFVSSVGIKQFDNVYFSVYLKNHSMVSLAGVSFVECVAECARRTSCKSVNYRRLFHLCDINDVLKSVTEMERSPYYTFWNGTILDIGDASEIESCLYGCQENKTCRIINHSMVCHFEECRKDIGVAYGYSEGNLNSVGSKRTMRCDEGRFLDSNETTQCLDNGTWSVHASCEIEPVHVTSPIEIPCINVGQCAVNNSECRDAFCRCISGHSYSYRTGYCVRSCVTFANTFQMEDQSKIPYNDVLDINAANVNVCKQACIDADFVCASIDYKENGKDCKLQSVTAHTDPTTYSGTWKYYQRDCID